MIRPHFISGITGCRGIMLAVFFAVGGFLTAQAPPDTEDIRPPRELVEIPQAAETPWTAWLVAAGVLLLLIIALMLWKRRALKLKATSPREVALASLRQLETACDKLRAEEFANRAAQTLREYIATRFGLAAPRRTTEEFLREVESSPLLGESDHLRTFLKSCDLAKFAGSELDSARRDELIHAARDFIQSTAEPTQIKDIKP